mmetsp:Transcript_14277/g.21766  ORF Transcript_14277/g.21766 Transcript_14277/m.21766 type:complete len:166 (+) Transcript_14277:99-596(+)
MNMKSAHDSFSSLNSNTSLSSAGNASEQGRISHLKNWCARSLTESLTTGQEMNSNYDSGDDSCEGNKCKTSMPGTDFAGDEIIIMTRLRRQSLQRKEKRLNLARHCRLMDQLYQHAPKSQEHTERSKTVFQELRKFGVKDDEAQYRQTMYSKLCTALNYNDASTC